MPRARRSSGGGRRGLGFAVVMILIGASLLMGTASSPRRSRCSARPRPHAIDPDFTPYVPWIACFILAGLFWFQHKGTKSIGGVFGPVMLVWFVALGLLGAWYIIPNPSVLRALNPLYALALLHHPPAQVTALLGAIVLAITGAEALYADMGHFGRRYIAWAWYGAALPGLVLNYFGQGAYMLSHPRTAENPFFALAPSGPIAPS